MVNKIHILKKKLNIDNHIITKWFENKGWNYYLHQLRTCESIQKGRNITLISPTGSGKTLAGFLPSFFDLSNKKTKTKKLHTIYISPLKSLTEDIEKNLFTPNKELNLGIDIQSRTGDTPSPKKRDQIYNPPSILATTIESFALLLSDRNFKSLFSNLKILIIDEAHSIANTKRGELLSLNITRLDTLNKTFKKILLSATVSNENKVASYFNAEGDIVNSNLIKDLSIKIINVKKRIPWSGHMAEYAIDEIYTKICKEKSIIFVNTRAQSELLFQNLWKINEKNLKIAVHHGSLEKNLRKKVEDQMRDGKLDCVVATSSLEMGLDWKNVSLIIQVGSPKGVTRLIQRIGRSNHYMGGTSKAILVPTNRLEFVECLAAIEAIEDNDLDPICDKVGSLDVLAQHITGVSCSCSIDPNNLYEQILKSHPYKNLKKKDFIKIFNFVVDGGYSLKKYKQFAKLKKNSEGNFEIASDKFITQYKMNVGTIVESEMVEIKLNNKTLGKIEEWFVERLLHGDTFFFGGKILMLENFKNNVVKVKLSKSKKPKIPSYAGGRMPLSTKLSERVLRILNNTKKWQLLPKDVQNWLELQRQKSLIPSTKFLLVESFPKLDFERKEYYYIFYTFEGKNVNDTLGFAISKCLENNRYKPLGFVTTDYALAIWVNKKVNNLTEIFNFKNIKVNIHHWLENSSLFKRNFKKVAIISGLIDKGYPGQKRKLSLNSELIFEVLIKYEKNHILLKATKQESKKELVELDRLNNFQKRIKSKIVFKELKNTSPLSVPLIIEINKEYINKNIIDEYYLEKLENKVLHDAQVNDAY